MVRFLTIAQVAFLVGCEFPTDPEGTLERVRGGVLRVGITPAEPFVRLNHAGDPKDVEVELVQRFAETLDARVEWVTGSVAVEANSPEAAKLEQDTDAVVVPVYDIAAAEGPVAVPDYQLDELGLMRTDAELDEHEHAIAAPMGENAFLVELERFLLDREAEAAAILEREGRP